MPLLNPRPDDPDTMARLAACQISRACLQRKVQLVHGKHFDEVRMWCDKMQAWKSHRVNSRQSWAQIFEPVVQSQKKLQ